MAMTMQDLAKRRVAPDSRGQKGIFSRGRNIYNGVSNSAVSGPQGPGFGRPGRMPPPTLGGNTSNSPRPVPNRFDRSGRTPPEAPFALPFDPAYAEKMREIASRRAGLESGFGLNQFRLGEDFRGVQSELGRGREEAIKALTQRMADQGMLYSGMNIGEQGKIGEGYQRAMGDITQQQTRGSEDLSRDFMGGMQGLRSEEETAGYNRIRDLIPGMLDKAYGEAENQAMQQWLQQYGGTPPVSFSPTGQVQAGMPRPVIPPGPGGRPAMGGRGRAETQKASIRPTKGALKRRTQGA
jgi:hypothetical protein